MKTDSLFYKLFQQSPQLVLELAGIAPRGAEDYQFRSEEIKQTAFRLDGVLLPPPDQTQWPLVFVEVQFQRDQWFYSRFFCEIFFYLRQNQPLHPWHAVVIYPGRSIESDGRLHYAALLESRQIQRLYLDEMTDRPAGNVRVRLIQLIAMPKEGAPQAARAMIAAMDKGELEADNKAQIVEMIETILVYKFPNLGREEVQKMLGYNDISLKQTRFYQDVYAEGQEEGRQEGRQEGLQEGRQKECMALIVRLLKRRLGNHPALEQATPQFRTMSLERLEDLAEALLNFSEPDDLVSWLQKHQNS